MMSRPARSMSRIAVSAASSNISSRSPGPYWPASYALTVANHHPGLPCDPTTLEGISGRSAIDRVSFEEGSRSRRYCMSEIDSAPGSSRRAADDTHHRAVSVDVLWPAHEDDLTALDDVQPGGELRHVVDVGLRHENGTAEAGDRGETLAHRRHD